MKTILLVFISILFISCNVSDPELSEQDGVIISQLSKKNLEKVDVCHKKNNGKYKKIQIAESAVKAHLNHGDGLPGQDVPDKPNYKFDDDCNCGPKIPLEGLVFYLPFNGNANDESDFSNNGTVIGATLTEDRFGNLEGAYEFDGIDDKIIFGDVDILDYKSEATFSVWINYSEHNGDYDPIITKGAIEKNESSYTLLYKSLGAGGLACQLVGEGQQQSVVHSHPNAADDGNWHHILATFKNKALTIYIDGIESSTYNESNCSSIQSTSDILTIGYNSRVNTETWFKGKIDDILIYDRALTYDEILMLLN